MSIENWKTDLTQLMFSFKAEPRTYSPDKRTTFTDQFGNHLDFGHTESDFLAPYLLKLLKNPDLKTVEVDDVDKGSLSYSLYKHEEDHSLGTHFYMLYETRVNLYGYCGHYTSFVVVPTLEPVIEFIGRNLSGRE